jgi:hypothetical protein
MILIYVDQITERLIYTLGFIFKDREIPYSLTNDFAKFQQSEERKFNYSDRIFKNCININPSSVIFDENIGVYGIDKGLFFEEECLSFNGKVDPLASIFYVLSRMEEYTSIFSDKFNRFEGKNSVIYRFNWHEKLICEHWCEDLLKFLFQKDIRNQKSLKLTLSILPTFDIDNTYAYKNKGLVRSFFSVLKDIVLLRTKRLFERQKVHTRFLKDPFDTFDQIASLKARNIDFKLFWLLGDFAKYDRNISAKNRRHHQIIKKMSEVADIGIHPSYKSNSYEYFLHNEIERLEAIIMKKVNFSRQHFLVLKFPYTYKTLIEQEITDDYTMGYADICGFRAGTSRPFKWFDLQKNETTKLNIHPFAFMDGTLNEYLKLTPKEAIEKIQLLFDEVKKYGGQFSFIWHNETIGNYGIWKDWSEVFDFSIDLNIK